MTQTGGEGGRWWQVPQGAGGGLSEGQRRRSLPPPRKGGPCPLPGAGQSGLAAAGPAASTRSLPTWGAAATRASSHLLQAAWDRAAGREE